MSASFDYFYEPVFPWSNTRNDDRFLRIAKWVLILFIVIGLIIPWLPSPEAEKKQLKHVSPRLAKLITQKRLQKPPAPKVKSVKKKTVEKKTRKEVVKKKTVQAIKKVQKSGLMAMSNDIQDLQSMFDLSSLSTSKPLKSSSTAAKTIQSSSVLSSKAKSSSGGIDTSQLSRNTGNTGLAGRQGTKVSSNLGNDRVNIPRRTQSGQNARAIEELTLVFDKYKGALQNTYQRALRKDPTLQGKVVFELTINAAGQVVNCKIISSELGNKSLERKLVLQVKSFRFSAKNVATVTVTMPIDLLPS
ncbi:MAG: TonB family protein [Gammaproteobacteria bacterium]|nr:TonB family protein [Gammaproteobacteria bacterium]